MKIAFTSMGKNWESKIDARFGRTEYIAVFNEGFDDLLIIDNNEVKNEAHGAGTATAQKIFELNPDVLITGNGPGDSASKALKTMKMKIFINAHLLTLKEAYEQFKKGTLTEI